MGKKQRLGFKGNGHMRALQDNKALGKIKVGMVGKVGIME